jgi:succinyl-CoA synthetase beta subunit
MLMLEHDAKEILSRHGVPVPLGVLVAGAALPALPFDGPAVVKAQVPAGGRGKAGGIRRAERASELPAILAELLGSRVKGHTVGECRIEQAVVGAEERYLSFSIEPASAAVTTQAGRLLAGLFLDRELTLLEINPLFVLDDGSFVVGDVKLIADDNALVRQPELAALLEARRHAYPDAAFKLEHGFDLVLLDPDGEVGLVTTGAGLSMQLVDEMIRAGARPYNFLDIRTGMMRGRPDRLILVLQQIARGPRIRSVLVNVFAGITDLGEFARLLLAALAQAPQLKVPVVARLIGNGLEAAQRTLGEAGIAVVTGLDVAIARVRNCLGSDPGPR